MKFASQRAWLLAFAATLALPSFAIGATASQNPDISVNALLLYKNSNRGLDPAAENRNGVTVQEAEMQFASDVDPYWRFVGTFSMSQESDGYATASAGKYTPHWTFEPEELFAESLDFNAFTVRVGKFKAAMGKHNQLHTHAYPFIDAPLQNQAMLGDEGVNDVGASVATLFPLPWFSELSLQALSGQMPEEPYFNAADTGGYVGLAHLKNLWDLSDTLTFELGLSGASGENSLATSTNLYGADATFKWRQSLERAVIWASEFLRRDLGSARSRGVASWIQFQATRRWWIEARGEYLDDVGAFSRKQSALIAFDPSEFSEIRGQYDHLADGRVNDEHRFLLQFNYTIGAHPAHSY